MGSQVAQVTVWLVEDEEQTWGREGLCRITELLRWEGTSGGHVVQPHLLRQGHLEQEVAKLFLCSSAVISPPLKCPFIRTGNEFLISFGKSYHIILTTYGIRRRHVCICQKAHHGQILVFRGRRVAVKSVLRLFSEKFSCQIFI